MLGRSAATTRAMPGNSGGSALAEFEQIYASNFDVVMAYFARRCAEPQVVADLTSETFVRAAAGFGSFDPGRGSARAWLFGIAAHVYAQHCEQSANGRDAVARLAGHRALDVDEIDELARQDRRRARRPGADRALLAVARSWSGRRSSWSTCIGFDAEGGRGRAWRLPRRAAQAAVPGADPA